MLTIKLNGESHPAFVTAGAMLYFYEMTGKEVTEIKRTADLIKYCYCCYRACCEREDNKPEYDCNQFANRIDMSDFNAWCTALAAEAQAQEADEKNAVNP